MAKMQDLAKRIFVVGHVQPPTLHRARFVPYCPERLRSASMTRLGRELLAGHE